MSLISTRSSQVFLSALFVSALVGCSSTTEPPATATGGAGTGGGGANASGAAGSSSVAGGGMTTGGGGSGGGSAGGAAGGGAGGTAGGGAGGASGSGGTGGAGGAAACTPVAGPGAGKMYTRSAWKAAWNVPCDFEQHGGCADALPAEKAFDGSGDTRTSIGNTHFENGSDVAQVIGDSFTFDMQACNKISKMVMWASTPPNNQGKYDPRDFPGEVKVTVANDCTIEGTTVTGTFGEVVATGSEAQPGCMQAECTMPLTINIDPPVAARCVKLELTEVLQLGGGIWWAMTELEVFE